MKTITSSRRGWRRATCALGLVSMCALPLAACGSSDDESDAASETTSSVSEGAVTSAAPGEASGAASTTAAAAAAAESEAAFPVTLTHALGEVTIEAAPERIVTLGSADLAVADALGAEIVGAVRNFSPTDPNLPYMTAKLSSEILALDIPAPGAAINVEKVATFRPDLILAVSSSQIDAASYAQLSQIAPVVAYEKSLYGSTIEDDALLIGRALGKEAEAQALIAEADAAVTAFAAGLPGLAGKTYLYGQARGDVIPLVVGKDNLSTQFMAKLGLTVPPEFADVSTSNVLAPGTIGISYEEAARLDAADVLFMTFPSDADKQTFESNAVVKSLKLLAESRYHPITLDTAIALQGPNIVAVPWLLEQLRPSLEQLAA